MNRRSAALVFAAGLLAPAPAALAADSAGGEEKSTTEQRLEEVLAELEAQREAIRAQADELRAAQAEIRDLKARIVEAPAQDGGLAGAVKEYLESDEGKKALGRGPGDFRCFWKDGLAFESGDKAFMMHVGGRLQYDLVFPAASGDVVAKAGDYNALGGFRRLRLQTEGTVQKNVYFSVEVEFAGAAYAWRACYFGLKDLPVVGNFQIGIMKEPMGLEELTSDLFTTFTERALPDALVPSYEHGAMLFNSYEDGRICWWAGDFWDGNVGPAPVQHNLTARVTGAPVMDRERNLVVHLGASVSDRSPESETDAFSSRPEAPFVPLLVNTGTFGVDSETLWGLEAAAAWGPWSVQGEWMRAHCSDHPDAPGPSPTFSGWYAQASWFPTGETRPYRNGTFQRIRPKANFDGKQGWGAVELAARYSVLDLDDDGINGGVADDWTLGVNWYLNANSHVSLNYVWADLHHVGGVRSVVVRFQVDF
jgi:phosphate-selective porin OprO/OprP